MTVRTRGTVTAAQLLSAVLASAKHHHLPVEKLQYRKFFTIHNPITAGQAEKFGTWSEIKNAAVRFAQGHPHGLRHEQVAPHDGKQRVRTAAALQQPVHKSPPVEVVASDPVEIEIDTSELDIDPPVPVRSIESAATPAVKPPQVNRYVITYAQNATPIDENFFASLLSYIEDTGATLLVIPGRYKNPTSFWASHAEDHDWWDERLAPYLYQGRMQLVDNLCLYGDISIQPTAVRPLTGFEVFAGTSSAIFAHPKFQLTTIPGPSRENVRILTTTGAVTVPNYTDSKAGRKAEPHHIQGAVVVEVFEDEFFLRQINATPDGSFIDLHTEYGPDGATPAEPPLGLVLGDVHVELVDENVISATLDREDSIVRSLGVREVVYHDLLDFRARNHHEIDDPNARFARAVGEEPDNVELEIQQAVAFVDERTPDGVDVTVIASNHDEAFDSWLKNADPRKDAPNARFFHQVRAHVLEHYERTREWIGAFELCYRKWGQNRATFVRREQPHRIGPIVCNYHGDKGTNGSRASLLSYAKLGMKMIIGHHHTPAILDGVYCTGVSGKLDMGYNDQPSSWAHAHCLIYANGKRTLLFIRNGRWRMSDDATVNQSSSD